jgi:hypothetical protein
MTHYGISILSGILQLRNLTPANGGSNLTRCKIRKLSVWKHLQVLNVPCNTNLPSCITDNDLRSIRSMSGTQ